MQNPYQQYVNSQVNTAPPEELTLMLYKGAVRFITLAIHALEEENIEEANKNVLKAEDIYVELITTLDKQYSIAGDLERVYDFLLYLLREANMRKDKVKLGQGLEMAKELAETWEEAIKLYRKGSKTEQIGQVG